MVTEKENRDKHPYLVGCLLFSIIAMSGLSIYAGLSMTIGSFNISKWKGLEQEIITIKKGREARVLDKAFDIWDSDGDGYLSRRELNVGMMEGFSNWDYGHSPYRHLNQKLNLGEGDYPSR